MTQNMFGRKVKVLRTDRGGEYINHNFLKFMAREGIQCQRTAPFTPQQNGVAERKNRTLVEMARCMLIDAELENKFWGEAVTMANYIQNRLPGKGYDKTPFENWYRKKPSISHCKKFGTICYVHVPNEKRRKLDAKAFRAILVGYDEESKAFRCYNQSNGKVVISRDVKFVEKFSDWDFEKNEDNITETTQNENCTENISFDDDATVGNDNNELYFNGVDNSIEEEPSRTDVENQPKVQVMDTEADTIRSSSRINKNIPPKRLIEEINKVEEEKYEPKTYRQAIVCSEKEKWVDAMKDEIKSLQENGTWELVPLPPNRKPIGCRWVFKLKTDSNGGIIRYKARLVAQGFLQQFGCDYDQTFAPVVKQTTMKILLSMAAKYEMKVLHFDAKTAFLNGELREEIFMRQPPGFVIDGKEDYVCFLKRSLYGLKQSARVWNESLHQTLVCEI